MYALVENFQFHSIYDAFIVGIGRMVARNIGDNNVRSGRFPQSFKGK